MITGFEQIVERRIREAIEMGAFDNLPGHGKPLELEDEGPDRENWLANKVLKNAGCLPPWIEVAREIDAIEDDLAALQARHERWVRETIASLPEDLLDRAKRRPGVVAIHERDVQRYREGLEEMKDLIGLHNQFAPTEQLYRQGFWLAARLRRFEQSFAPLLEALGGTAVDLDEVEEAAREWEARERRQAFYQKWKRLTEKLDQVHAQRARRRR